MNVMGGLGPDAGSFISSLGEDVPLTSFEIEVSHAVTLAGAPIIEATGGTGPTDVTLTAGGAGPNGGVLHTVTLTGAAPAGERTTLTLGVVNEAGCEGTLTMSVAHLPLDVTQDGQVNIQDITAWGAEFNCAGRAALVDTNGDGNVNVQDATRVGDMWFGRPPATRAWNGATLP